MALADTVRTTLGPRGMDKLIHDDKVGACWELLIKVFPVADVKQPNINIAGHTAVLFPAPCAWQGI